MLKPISILVCLNSESEANAVANAFNMVGCSSTVLPSDGERVLAAIIDGLYDYAVMDSCLPGIDAAAIISEARNALHLPKFIVLDLIYCELTHRLLISVGTAYYMVKPTDAEHIVDKVLKLSDCSRVPLNADTNDGGMSLFDKNICELFRRFGIPASINGYVYLKRAIAMTVDSQTQNKKKITKDLYPTLAEEFNTTPSRVERAMRHAITIAWNRGDIEALESYFGYTVDEDKGKPTNSEFIAMVSEAFRNGELENVKMKKAL